MTEVPKTAQINLKRPKVALRRITDPRMRRLVKAYDLNRGTQAEGKVLEWINTALRNGQ